jgi:hypothetical protein
MFTPFQIHQLQVQTEGHHNAPDIATSEYLEANHYLPDASQI